MSNTHKAYQYNLAQSSRLGQAGFESFKNENDDRFYFHFNDAKGEALLFSQAYRREIAWYYSQGAPAVFEGDLQYYLRDHDLRGKLVATFCQTHCRRVENLGSLPQWQRCRTKRRLRGSDGSVDIGRRAARYFADDGAVVGRTDDDGVGCRHGPRLSVWLQPRRVHEHTDDLG